MILWLAYSMLTILAYGYGPYLYSPENDHLLYSYLVLVHIGFIAGYLKGSRFAVNSRDKSIVNLNLTLSILSFAATTGLLVSLIGDYLYGITFGAGLRDPIVTREIWIYERSGTFYSHFSLALSVANFPLIALTVGHWKYLSTLQKLPGILLITFITIGGIAGGSRHGIMTIWSAVWIVLLVRIYTGEIDLRKRTLYAATAIGIVAFLLYGSFIAAHRSDIQLADYSRYMLIQRETPVDTEHVFFYILPIPIAAGILQGLYYFTHGYEWLGVALSKPFIGIAFGVGHSYFLCRVAARLGWSDVYDYSYFFRLNQEDGLLMSKWATSYIWIASDTTFVGSIVVMGALGWLLGRSWILSRSFKDPIALTTLAWIWHCMMQMPIIFVPGDYGQLIGFYGTILLFLRVKNIKLPEYHHRISMNQNRENRRICSERDTREIAPQGGNQ